MKHQSMIAGLLLLGATMVQAQNSEQATAFFGTNKLSLNVVNLGLSVSTLGDGLQAPIIEVPSFSALDSMGARSICVSAEHQRLLNMELWVLWFVRFPPNPAIFPTLA